jgi:hypothetical protein
LQEAVRKPPPPPESDAVTALQPFFNSSLITIPPSLIITAELYNTWANLVKLLYFAILNLLFPLPAGEEFSCFLFPNLAIPTALYTPPRNSCKEFRPTSRRTILNRSARQSLKGRVNHSTVQLYFLFTIY